MKMDLFSTVNYYGKPAKIKCTVEDVNGYISITGEITPYRCKKVYCCGCIHEYIMEAFPELAPFIWLHLANLDGSVTYEIENSLYFLANDDLDAAHKFLGCNYSEIMDLYDLVRFGLHRSKTNWRYKDNKTGYQISDENSVKTYETALNKLNLRSRRLQAIRDLYSVLSGMK